MRKSKTAIALLAMAFAAAALTGCGGEPDFPPALSPAQATDEYRAEAAKLDLAPGWSWPQAPIPATAPDGEGVVYEPGYGTQAADFYWYCSWSAQALDATLSPQDTEAALTKVIGVKSTYYYTTALVPESRPLLDDVLESALLGDLGPLKNDFELNCRDLAGGK